jgi:YVTN family beta-propeller protein
VTHAFIAYIATGPFPSALAFSADSTRAYVLNAGVDAPSATVSVIDVASNAVINTVALGGSPQGLAITPDGSTLFVTNYGDGTHSGTVSVVSTATNSVTSTISNVGVGPITVKVSPDGTQAWILAYQGGTVSVVDVATKAIVNRYSVIGGGPWNLAFTPDGKQAWLTVDGRDNNLSGTVDVFDVKSARWNPTVARVSGADRYQTSVAVAKQAFPTTAPVVFIATGTGFADALAAAAPAAKLGGPLLLTDPNGLPASVKAEIISLHPSTIYIVGGTGAVSAKVAQQLAPLATTVTRFAGTDRFDTARKVIDAAFPTMQKVYVATGLNFPDALSASAAAGAAGIPVLLVNGSKASLDTATTDFLTSHGANAFTVVGGPTVVSAGIATQLGTSGPVTRIFGADRTATSQLINSDAFPTATKAYFATGLQFADALSGAVLAAVKGAPLYTVSPTCVPDGSEADLAARGVTDVTLIGGTGALNANVAAMRNC